MKKKKSCNHFTLQPLLNHFYKGLILFGNDKL